MMGIPTRYVRGVTGNLGAHAWNEAYADGRWIILDTTWDSQNRYENGIFSEAKPCSTIYFDPSLEAFSESHRIERDEYDPYDPYLEVSNALYECLSISKTKLVIKKGKTKQISVKASEKGIDFKDLSIIYSSSNKKVATVSKKRKNHREKGRNCHYYNKDKNEGAG